MSDATCKCGHSKNRHTEFMPKNRCIGSPTTGVECTCIAFEPADRDDLAAILAKHAYDPGLGCVCGGIDWRKNAGPMKPIHRAHVASMVLESDWLRGVRAKELRDAADAIQAAIESPTDPSVDAYHFDGLDEAATICRDRADRVDAEDGGR